MREEAERYCSLIETVGSSDRVTFAPAVAQSLAALVSAASRLASLDPGDMDTAVAPRRGQEQWKVRFDALQRTLAEWAYYWTVPPDTGYDAPPTALLPLADDLADIWLDLQHGLDALRLGAEPADVEWEWRFTFYTHWGRHATEALRALHARVADGGGPPPPRPAD
jgi:hypothetical protein